MKIRVYLFIGLVFFGVCVLLKAEEKELPNPDDFLFFQKEKPLELTNVHGKGVLMIFCQGHSIWGPPMLKQVENKYKNNPNFLLVAIKTRCENISDAKSYFEDIGLDFKYWIIGYEKNASYIKSLSEEEAYLWPYVLINAEGKVVESGSSGTFRSGLKPKKFIIALEDKVGLCGVLKTQIPEGKYPEELSPVIYLVEIGAYAAALKKLDSMGKKSKHKAELKELRLDICDTLSEEVKKDLEYMTNSKIPFTKRYSKYIKLGKIVKSLKKEKFLKQAQLELKKMSKAPEMAKEKAAEKEYVRIMKKYNHSYSSRDKGKRQKALMKLTKKYPDTKYATIALRALGSN